MTVSALAILATLLKLGPGYHTYYQAIRSLDYISLWIGRAVFFFFIIISPKGW